MTINEAIARVDDLRDNTMPANIKITWLQMVDQQVYHEIIKGRVGADAVTLPDYSDENGDRVLLVTGTAATKFSMEAPLDAAVVAIIDQEENHVSP